MRIAAIDPAKVNFAIIVEEYPNDIPVVNINKKVSREMVEKKGLDFDCIFGLGKTVLVEKIDLTTNCEKSKYLDPKVFINLTLLLDKYIEIWDTCDVILIEQQMSFGKKPANPMATKIAQHCYSYFIIKYASFKTIIDFPAYLKTQILLAPKVVRVGKKAKPTTKKGAKEASKEKADRKKWSSNKAEEVWLLRDDFDTVAKVESMSKRDDVSDCLMMTLAYYIMATSFV